MFIDFSSALSTGIVQQPSEDYRQMYTGLFDMIGKFTSSTVLNTGAPQGYALNPLLFPLLTNDCELYCAHQVC